MRALLVAGLLLATMLAGCSGGGSSSSSDLYTCKTGLKKGQQIDVSNATGHGKTGFDPESACPQPIPPSITILGLPATVKAFYPVKASWALSSGSWAGGHSMLNELRINNAPVSEAGLTEDNFALKYPTQLLKFEHQELPSNFSGTFSIDTAGMYHARVFGQIKGTDLDNKEYWTSEVMIMVEAPTATGNTTTLTVPQGFPAQKTTSLSASVQLGDGIIIDNKGSVPITAKFSENSCAGHAEVTVGSPGMPATSASIPLLVPGSCKVHIYTGSDAAATATAEDIEVSVQHP